MPDETAPAHRPGPPLTVMTAVSRYALAFDRRALSTFNSTRDQAHPSRVSRDRLTLHGVLRDRSHLRYCPYVRRPSAVDSDRLAGDVARVFRRQEHHGGGDILSLSKPGRKEVL
jgi:hypothetical protein